MATTSDFKFGVPGTAEPPEPPEPDPSVSPQGTGIYEYNPFHMDEAIANLIEFFRKPRNKHAVGILANQIQELENAYNDLIEKFDVNTAVGDQLDKLGARVIQYRNDKTDDLYRIAIKTRILVNMSNGTLPELLTILETAQPGITVAAREEYPAGLLFRIFDLVGPPTVAAELIVLIRQAKPAGVRIHGIFGDSVRGFRWSSVSAAGQTTNRAFSTVTPGGDGGLLQRVLA